MGFITTRTKSSGQPIHWAGVVALCTPLGVHLLHQPLDEVLELSSCKASCFVCLFVCLVGCLFVCLFGWLFVCLFV